jgi:endonuclease-3
LDLREKAALVCGELKRLYPEIGKCFLDYGTPWQLMVATILSAQCTDSRVNEVTKTLFVKYPSPAAFALANPSELERDVYSTGFFRAKTRGIINSMRKLIEDYQGEMPSGMAELTSFDGVGRKTANVIRCHVFGLPAIVVDTHVKRLSARIGLTKNTDPGKVEFDLMDIVPEDERIAFNPRMIAHGRAVCAAKKPLCGECRLAWLCSARTG